MRKPEGLLPSRSRRAAPLRNERRPRAPPRLWSPDVRPVTTSVATQPSRKRSMSIQLKPRRPSSRPAGPGRGRRSAIEVGKAWRYALQGLPAPRTRRARACRAAGAALTNARHRADQAVRCGDGQAKAGAQEHNHGGADLYHESCSRAGGTGQRAGRGGEQGARCWQSCARNHARLQEPGQQAGQGLRVARQQAEHRRRAARPRAAAAPRECERRHIFTPRMRMILYP